jgi:hypothetical protein
MGNYELKKISVRTKAQIFWGISNHDLKAGVTGTRDFNLL